MIEKCRRGPNPLVRRGAPGRDRTCDHRIRRVRRAVHCRPSVLLRACPPSVLVRAGWRRLPSALPSGDDRAKHRLHRRVKVEPEGGARDSSLGGPFLQVGSA